MQWETITDQQQWLWFGAAGVLVVLVALFIGYSFLRSKPRVGAVSVQLEGWTPTGRIDFSNSQSADHFILQAEDTRIVDSLGGVERREIRWRTATLEEAKAVVIAYYAQRNLTTAANFVVRSSNSDVRRATTAEPRQEVEPVREEAPEVKSES
jgi:hypothetical protein